MATLTMRALWREEYGTTTVEYALLVALVALAAIGAFTALGDRMGVNLTSSATRIGENPNP